MDSHLIAGGIVVIDISDELPKHPTKKYSLRKDPVTALFVHHSGADSGHDGIDAFIPMANWHVYGETEHKTRWPGIAYHWGITLRRSLDTDGNLIIYQLEPANVVSYHTGGCNRFSEGIVLQGHLGETPLSNFQVECLEALIPWRCEVLGIDYHKDLGWHSRADDWGGHKKATCPGKYAVEWLERYINDEQ